MRENSIGWTDGMDGVEFLEDIESIFAVRFTDEESVTLETIGDLFDAIVAKLPPGGSKCASAMAFYRLRQALGAPDMTPASDITALNSEGAKTALQRLRDQTGLTVPRSRYARLGSTGCTIGVLGAVALVVGLAAFLTKYNGSAFFAAAALAITTSLVATHFDKGLLPRSCETLGGLAKATASASYGLLVGLGARVREKEIWEIVTALLAERGSRTAPEIDRDTTFYKNQKRKAA